MKNEEAIKKLKDFKYLEYSNGIEFSGRAKEELDKAFDIAINSIQENTKLKTEIEQLKSELEQAVELPDRRIEKPIEEYSLGYIGKGFDVGWNACLDRIDLLRKLDKCEVKKC